MIALTVTLQVKPGHLDGFLDAITANAEATFAEPGCRYFDINQALEDDHTFTFYELYVDEEAAARQFDDGAHVLDARRDRRQLDEPAFRAVRREVRERRLARSGRANKEHVRGGGLSVLTQGRTLLLLADEPTGNLDESTGRSIVDLIFALRRERGATLVLVTHDPGAVRALEPERVIIMPEGDEDMWSDEYMEIVELA